MIFTATPLAGVYLIDVEPISDHRGFFARTWCNREFVERGLDANWMQCSVSYNRLRGTLRGMHYQREPAAEAKLVTCTHGAIYDVVVDVRAQSSTFRNWFAIELRGGGHRSIYVPRGCAHGFLTLTDDTELHYSISEFHAADAECGFRWDDPTFGIEWPSRPTVIASRDAEYPDFTI